MTTWSCNFTSFCYAIRCLWLFKVIFIVPRYQRSWQGQTYTSWWQQPHQQAQTCSDWWLAGTTKCHRHFNISIWKYLTLHTEFPTLQCWWNSLLVCCRLQPATILTRLIAALTWFPEWLLYAYPCITMTTSSDLETVDVSWITWVNCSFRISAIFTLYCRCICAMLTFYNATKRLHIECLFNLASFSIARTYHYIVWQTSRWQNKNYIFGNDAIPTHYYWPI